MPEIFPCQLPSGVSRFARGRAEILRIRIPEGNMLHNRLLSELSEELRGNVLICGVERNGEVYIPSGSFRLQQGDELSFVCPSLDSKAFLGRVGFDAEPARQVMIGRRQPGSLLSGPSPSGFRRAGAHS